MERYPHRHRSDRDRSRDRDDYSSERRSGSRGSYRHSRSRSPSGRRSRDDDLNAREGWGHRRSPDDDRYSSSHRSRSPQRRPRKPSVDEPSSTVIMKGIPETTTDQVLWETVAAYAPTAVRILTDRDTGRNKDIAFIDFATEEHAKALVSHYGRQEGAQTLYIGGVPVVVRFAESSRRPQDWLCGECGAVNFSRRTSCFRCQVIRPPDAQLVEKGYRPPRENTWGGGPPQYQQQQQPPPHHQQQQHQGFRSQTPPAQSIIARGLPLDATEEEVRLVKDRVTNLSRGFAFIEFPTVDVSTYVLESLYGAMRDRLFFRGSKLTLDYAKDTHRAHQWQAFNAPPGGAGAVSLTSGPGVNYYPGYGGTSDAAPQASAPRSLAEAAMQYAAQSQFQPTEAVGGGGGAGEQAASAVAAATAAAAASSAPLPSPAAPMDTSAVSAAKARAAQRKSEVKTGSDRCWPVHFEDAGMNYMFEATTGLYRDTKSGFLYNDATGVYLDPQSGWLFKWRGDMKKFQRFIPPLPQPKPAVSSKRKEKSGKSETAPKKRLKVPSTATKKSSDNSAGGVVKVSVITPGSAEPKIVEQRVITSEPTSELVTPSTRTLKGVKGAEQSKLITKWNSLQQSEQTSDKKPICYLCKRKFGSMELLKKHEKLSDLHKKNLEKKKQEDANYRDRAAERRAITAPSESEIELRQREQQLEAEARSVAEVSEGSEGNREEAKSEENIGSKLLKAMGWDGKSGLGRENQGIVAPVDAVETLGGKAMNDSTGLGALPKGTVVPGGNIQANKAAQRLKAMERYKSVEEEAQ